MIGTQCEPYDPGADRRASGELLQLACKVQTVRTTVDVDETGEAVELPVAIDDVVPAGVNLVSSSSAWPALDAVAANGEAQRLSNPSLRNLSLFD